MFYSDDPVKDAERYYAAQEREQKKLPVCDLCDHTITGEHFFEINGDIICEDCLIRDFRKAVEDYVD